MVFDCQITSDGPGFYSQSTTHFSPFLQLYFCIGKQNKKKSEVFSISGVAIASVGFLFQVLCLSLFLLLYIMFVCVCGCVCVCVCTALRQSEPLGSFLVLVLSAFSFFQVFLFLLKITFE